MVLLKSIKSVLHTVGQMQYILITCTDFLLFLGIFLFFWGGGSEPYKMCKKSSKNHKKYPNIGLFLLAVPEVSYAKVENDK